MSLSTIPLFSHYQISGYFSHKIPKKDLFKFFPEVFFPKQIHSDKILEIDAPLLPLSKEGDAVVSTLKGYKIGVQSADCLPILIAHKGREIIAAVHAGWRGTLQGIVYKTLKYILHKGFNPKDLLLAIGPHIQVSCYEVGDTILHLLERDFRKPPYLLSKNGHYYLNLAQMNLFQALEAKIPRENLLVSKECTCCLSQKYHSYRREKNLNYTQVALIQI